MLVIFLLKLLKWEEEKIKRTPLAVCKRLAVESDLEKLHS